MRTFILIGAMLCFSAFVNGQTFTTNSSLPLALSGGSQDITGCSSNRSITFNVSGVGTLSSSNQLLEIKVQIKNDRYLEGQIFLKAPNGGPCIQVANHLGDVGFYGSADYILDYDFRAPQPCLTKSPDYKVSSSSGRIHYGANETGNTGVFSTMDDISTLLNGVNADGTWTMYFGRGSLHSSNNHQITGASLHFGDPIAVPAPNPSLGTSCADAYVWDGSPACLTTEGKSNTSNHPSTSTSGCEWLSTSENNLWIAFTPTEPNVCINLSGIRRDNQNPDGVQSIIVQPQNSGSPCSGNWTVVACPRDNIYSSTVGTTLNQNYCFTATPGQTYYLVADGNAGAITDVYLTGTSGLPVLLPIELISFNGNCDEKGNIDFTWSTASETNNAYFTLQQSVDGMNWNQVVKINGNGTTSSVSNYTFKDRQFYPQKVNYFRLKQTDFNGEEKIVRVISVFNCNQPFNGKVQVAPNPTVGFFSIQVTKPENVTDITIFDIDGKTVSNLTNISNTQMLDFSQKQKGMYFLRTTYRDGSKDTQRIFVQ